MYNVMKKFGGFIKKATMKKKIRAVFAVTAVVCIALIGVRSVPAVIHNSALHSEFKENQSKVNTDGIYYLSYSQVKSMYQIANELSGYSGYTLYPTKLTHGKEYFFNTEHEITFYSCTGIFEKPVAVIKKGTKIRFDTRYLGLNFFPNSFPTFQRGWRFVSISGGIDDKSVEKLNYAYVKIEDLENLWRDFQKNFPEGAELVDKSADITSLIYVSDNILKYNGIYLSPDLLEPVWDWLNTLLILPAVICLIYILWSYFKRKFKRT